MNEIIIKLLIFILGVFLGAFVLAILAAAGRTSDEDRMDIMRLAMKKQDDAIRRKQNRIDELERKNRRDKRHRNNTE